MRTAKRLVPPPTTGQPVPFVDFTSQLLISVRGYCTSLVWLEMQPAGGIASFPSNCSCLLVLLDSSQSAQGPHLFWTCCIILNYDFWSVFCTPVLSVICLSWLRAVKFLVSMLWQFSLLYLSANNILLLKRILNNLAATDKTLAHQYLCRLDWLYHQIQDTACVHEVLNC